jgi:hypothetical protein
MFAGKAGALGLNGLPGTNTGLLRKSVNYSCKKFYRIVPWRGWLRPFYDCQPMSHSTNWDFFQFFDVTTTDG